MAATIMPITFQPTLMPRSGLDQALVTGISTSLNYALAALIQDSIEAVAPFAGAVMAAVNDYRRRRWETSFPGVGADEGAPASAVKSLAMSLGVTAALTVIPGQFEAKGHDYRADLARFVREVYGLAAGDEQLAAVERALRAAELERKRLLDAAKAAAAGHGQAGGSASSRSNAASRS